MLQNGDIIGLDHRLGPLLRKEVDSIGPPFMDESPGGTEKGSLASGRVCPLYYIFFKLSKLVHNVHRPIILLLAFSTRAAPALTVPATP